MAAGWSTDARPDPLWTASALARRSKRSPPSSGRSARAGAHRLIEQSLFEEVIRSEEAGSDAVIVRCLYDPGVRVARELVDIPVIGPLEASFQTAANLGHSTMVLTDHRKAVPYISTTKPA